MPIRKPKKPVHTKSAAGHTESILGSSHPEPLPSITRVAAERRAAERKFTPQEAVKASQKRKLIYSNVAKLGAQNTNFVAVCQNLKTKPVNVFLRAHNFLLTNFAKENLTRLKVDNPQKAKGVERWFNRRAILAENLARVALKHEGVEAARSEANVIADYLADLISRGKIPKKYLVDPPKK